MRWRRGRIGGGWRNIVGLIPRIRIEHAPAETFAELRKIIVEAFPLVGAQDRIDVFEGLPVKHLNLRLDLALNRPALGYIFQKIGVNLLPLIRIKIQVARGAAFQYLSHSLGPALQHFRRSMIKKYRSAESSGKISKDKNQDDSENGFPVAGHK